LKEKKVGALSGFFDQKNATGLMEKLQRSKYRDLIILLTVILAFFVLIIVSAA
jgi:hypothetical protein